MILFDVHFKPHRFALLRWPGSRFCPDQFAHLLLHRLQRMSLLAAALVHSTREGEKPAVADERQARRCGVSVLHATQGMPRMSNMRPLTTRHRKKPPPVPPLYMQNHPHTRSPTRMHAHGQHRVLVTGGGGFVGAHVCLCLLQRGHHVVVLDNFSTATRDALDNLPAVAGRAPALYEGDIRNIQTLRRVFELEHVTAVVHLAAFSVSMLMCACNLCVHCSFRWAWDLLVTAVVHLAAFAVSLCLCVHAFCASTALLGGLGICSSQRSCTSPPSRSLYAYVCMHSVRPRPFSVGLDLHVRAVVHLAAFAVSMLMCACILCVPACTELY